ncbi:MAG: sigma 54-interacting transcriptional regulator [Magnetococcales bacterium]|nr:sigma 54-interacting transcriptional regulator [Magnetococcales bacterium]
MDVHASPHPDTASSQWTRLAFLSTMMEAINLASSAINQFDTPAAVMQAVLQIMHECAGMSRGVICLTDPDSGSLIIRAIHDGAVTPANRIFYRPGEGILGLVVRSGDTVVVEQPALEPRFVRRLGVMDPDLPFIGVPIPLSHRKAGGVLAAQPRIGNRSVLKEQVLFMETIANLIAQRILSCRDRGLCLFGNRPALLPPAAPEQALDDLKSLIVGDSDAMEPVFQRIHQASRWTVPVLVQGASGTGKELVARAIHRFGSRSHSPFVTVNCAALADNLLESELFGHEKGAFTGAVQARPGRFELAHGGTLFLDEIGEISPAFQSKLLRVLQEGEFERVGGSRTLKVDVRIIAATNQDLFLRVQEGAFREDLFYRLFVLPIVLPELAARRQDVPQLVARFLERIQARQRRPLHLTPAALDTLVGWSWPGNVRELENCLERAAALSLDGVIDTPLIQFPAPWKREGLATDPGNLPLGLDPDHPDLNDRERVMAALEKSGWVQAKAARLLGMTPRQIAYRIKILGIPMRHI